jgi:enoyl-CoA hydratase/carnithine racemase
VAARVIVAACDVVIAADDAMFSIAETRWGCQSTPQSER